MENLKFRFWDEDTGNYKYFTFKDIRDGSVKLPSGNIEIQQYSGMKDKNGIDIYIGDNLGRGSAEARRVYFGDGSFRLRDEFSNQADQILVPFTSSKLFVMRNNNG